MPLNISQTYQTHFLVFLGHLVLSLGALDPLATISREDMELFYQGMGEDCIIPEVSSSSDHFPTFELDSPFSVSNTVGIYSVLTTKMEEDGSSGPVVDWKDLANFTNEIIGIFEWYRTSNCSRMVRFPTEFSQGSDLLDDEILKLTSDFVEDHRELLVLFDTSLPSVVNVLSPRAGVEALRIFMTHNDGILWENQRGNTARLGEIEVRIDSLEEPGWTASSGREPPGDESPWETYKEIMGSVKKLELRVNTLENSDRLPPPSREKDSPDVSPLLSCENVTCSTDSGAIGFLFEGGLAEAVTTSFALSILNLAVILVTGVVIYRRNYQIVSRTRVLEMKMGSHGGNRDVVQRRGNGMSSQRGPCLPRLEMNIFDAPRSSFGPHRCPQPRMDHCLEAETPTPFTGIVRNAVRFSPAAPTQRVDGRRRYTSVSLTDEGDGRKSFSSQGRRPDPFAGDSL